MTTGEFRPIARHAATVLTGQLAVMAFGVTDTLVAGRQSPEALATLSVGSAVYVSVFVALMGVLQALLPIWAEIQGAGHPQRLGRSVRQSLYLSGLAGLLGMAALLLPGLALEWTQVPEALQPAVREYLAVLALALPASLLFRQYSTLNQALHRPKLVTWLQLAGLVLKVPLSMALAWGGPGWPALGATGCALATLLVNYVMLGLAVWMLRSQALYAPYRLWQALERPDVRQLGTFLRLGIPAGLSILVEVTSFTLMALFIARLGTTAAASHQIASNLAAVLYMMPLSIAIATSARTSYWLGAERPDLAAHAARTGLLMAFTLSVVFSSLLLATHRQLPWLYTHEAEVAGRAAALLFWVALYHLSDGLQTVCAFVLRCYRITLAPLLVYSTLLWGAGLAGGYVLAYRGLAGRAAWQTADAFWASSAAALAAVALIFMPILWRAMRRRQQPGR